MSEGRQAALAMLSIGKLVVREIPNINEQINVKFIFKKGLLLKNIGEY